MTKPVVCGVYCLFLKHELIYVGKSRDAYARIGTHRANGREFDYATVATCPESDLAWIEAAMIKAMEPVKNRAGKAMVKAVAAANGAAPEPEIIREVIIRPIGKASVERTPDMPVMLQDARELVKQYCLSPTSLMADIDTGVMPSYPKDSRSGPGSPRIILYGDLIAWRDARQQERVKNGPLGAR